VQCRSFDHVAARLGFSSNGRYSPLDTSKGWSIPVRRSQTITLGARKQGSSKLLRQIKGHSPNAAHRPSPCSGIAVDVPQDSPLGETAYLNAKQHVIVTRKHGLDSVVHEPPTSTSGHGGIQSYRITSDTRESGAACSWTLSSQTHQQNKLSSRNTLHLTHECPM
jgi:hypothetical protein